MGCFDAKEQKCRVKFLRAVSPGSAIDAKTLTVSRNGIGLVEVGAGLKCFLSENVFVNFNEVPGPGTSET